MPKESEVPETTAGRRQGQGLGGGELSFGESALRRSSRVDDDAADRSLRPQWPLRGSSSAAETLDPDFSDKPFTKKRRQTRMR